MSTTGSPAPPTVTRTDSAGARAIENARDVSASSSKARSHIGSLRRKKTARDGEPDERDGADEQEPGRHVHQHAEPRDQQQAREASERNGSEELGEWVARERRENPDRGVRDRREYHDRRRPKGRARERVDTPPDAFPSFQRRELRQLGRPVDQPVVDRLGKRRGRRPYERQHPPRVEASVVEEGRFERGRQQRRERAVHEQREQEEGGELHASSPA